MCAAMSGVVAVVAWCSWWHGNWWIGTLGADYVPMAPSTAFLFVLLGGAMVLHQYWPSWLGTRVFSYMAGAVVLLFSVFVTAQYLGGAALPLRDWLSHPTATVNGFRIGVMAPVTAKMFLLAAVAWLFLLPPLVNRRFFQLAGAGLGLSVLLTGLVVIVGYSMGKPLYYTGDTIPMAWLTAVAFVFLGLALLFGNALTSCSRLASGLAGASRQFGGGLVIFFLLVAVMITISGFFFLQQQQLRAGEDAQTELKVIADQKARQISEWRRRCLADARRIKESPFATRAIGAFVAGPESDTQRAEMVAWLKSTREHGRFERVLIVDTQRLVRAVFPVENNELDPKLKGNISNAIQSNRTVIVDLHTSSKIPTSFEMDILVPVTVPGGSRPVAVVVLEIDAGKFLFPLLRSWPTRSQTGEAFLVRREGNDVVYLSELRHHKAAALKLRVPVSKEHLPEAMAARGEEGVVEASDYRDTPVLAVTKRIRHSTLWFLVTKQDQSEVYAALNRQVLIVGFLGVGVLLGVALGVSLLWRAHEHRHLQQQLMMTERIAHLVKTANDIIVLLDENWNIVEANDRAAEKYGYTREELLRMNIRELRAPEEQAKFDQQLKQVDTQGMLLETRHRRKDGATFPIESSVRAVQIEGRRYFEGIIRDITERKQLEQELLRMNRLHTALSQINEIVARVQTQAELFCEVCRALVEFGGFKLARLGWLDADAHSLNTLAQHGDDAAAQTARAAACVPLRVDEKNWGAITVYAEDTGMFGDKEMVLLEEVAVNVSFAMDHLDQEARRREAERWLADKEERFRQMFTSMSSGVVVYEANHDGTDFIIRDLNPAGETITHVSVRDMVGRPATEVFPGLREMGLLEVFQRVWRTGVAEHFDAHLYHDEKLTFWAENYVYRLSTGEIVAVFDDVTQRKQAEAALRESEEQFRTMADFTYDWELWIATDGQFRYVSPSCLRITGHSAKEFREDPNLFLRIIHPEDRAVVAEHMATTGVPSPPLNLDFRIITRSGEVRWINHVCQAVFRSDGTYLGRRASNRDITERKKTEDERSRLFAAMEQAAETVVITDVDARILYTNPSFERTTGYARHEVLGLNPRILKSDKHDASFYHKMWDTLTRGEVWHGHLINKRKDGSFYEEDATISPVRDDSGRIVNYIALKLDITREVELQNQLNHAMKMDAIGRLAGGVAHDFNNLLNVIMGYGEMVMAKLDPSSPLYKPISQMTKAGERAAGLTRQLRAFTRKQVIEPRILDLNTAIHDLHTMLRRLVREDIEIKLALSPNLGRVRADPTQIEQIITNLVANAHDAMPQGGTLTIETCNITLDADAAHTHAGARPGEYVQLAIHDTGIGMTDEVKAHIFEPFFTTKDTGKGTGLGLATCYGAVMQNGGHIFVESVVGQGTSFHVCLPRVADRPQRKSGDKTIGALPIGTETILLVEDDEAVRQLAETMLAKLGYQVLVAASGEQALQIAEQKAGTIHLLLTDVVMPQMNGKQLAEELHKRHPHIKKLFVSGYVSHAVTGDGAFEPGTLLLQKPYSSFALATKVREALEKT
jgi:PAS domain S-box-containing protein